jgi:hypothetical protein
MGGFNEGTSGGSKDHRTSKTTTKLGDFIRSGGITGAIVRGVSDTIKKGKAKAKDRKINDSYLGSPDYQGDVSAKSRSVDPRTGRDNDGPTIATVTNKKSIEQPKVKSQMNNTDVKSDMITAKAPDVTEMTADEILLKNKRKGRKSTVLTSVTGVDAYPTLSKKTLLG